MNKLQAHTMLFTPENVVLYVFCWPKRSLFVLFSYKVRLNSIYSFRSQGKTQDQIYLEIQEAKAPTTSFFLRLKKYQQKTPLLPIKYTK